MRIFYNLLYVLVCLCVSCNLEDPSEGINTDDVIQVKCEKTHLLADGVDNTIVTATLGNQSDDNKDIEFTTEAGSFRGSNNDDPKIFNITSSLKEAETVLVANTEEIKDVLIYAKVGNFKNSTRIDFERAYAEKMTLEASKLSIKKDGNDESEITVRLFRTVGEPTSKAVVNFETTALDTALVEIIPFASTSGTTATAKVKSKNGYPGKVLITASTLNGENISISRSITISIEE